ncbi:MAG: hypothetical protein KBD17_02270 [Candidatus Pacebacteria bacterium]|nr:hypothetical protein [Candidatus Paceibacterota bacterium]
MSILIVLDKAIIDNNQYPDWAESYESSSLFFMGRIKGVKAHCVGGSVKLTGPVTIAVDDFDDSLFEFADNPVKAIIVRPMDGGYDCFLVSRIKKDNFVLGSTSVQDGSKLKLHIDFLISYCAQTTKEYTIEDWLKHRDIPEQAAEFKFIDIA